MSSDAVLAPRYNKINIRQVKFRLRGSRNTGFPLPRGVKVTMGIAVGGAGEILVKKVADEGVALG
jgi:hypothetical protein